MKSSKIYLMILSLAALHMPLFLKSRGANEVLDTVPKGFLEIEELGDAVAICFLNHDITSDVLLQDVLSVNDYDITSGILLQDVLSHKSSNLERRIFEMGDRIIQVTYKSKTRLLSVVIFVKNKSGNYRPIIKTEKKLRSAIQLYSEKICYPIIETLPCHYHIEIPTVKAIPIPLPVR